MSWLNLVNRYEIPFRSLEQRRVFLTKTAHLVMPIIFFVVTPSAFADNRCPERNGIRQAVTVDALEAIQKGISTKKDAVYDLYQGAQSVHGPFADKVVYELRVHPSGAIGSVCVIESHSTPAALLEAVRYLLLSVRLNAWHESHTLSVNYPIFFSPE
nr:hypothetical protein [Oceanococcus sp. HetDA_MAG_MS8]